MLKLMLRAHCRMARMIILLMTWAVINRLYTSSVNARQLRTQTGSWASPVTLHCSPVTNHCIIVFPNHAAVAVAVVTVIFVTVILVNRQFISTIFASRGLKAP